MPPKMCGDYDWQRKGRVRTVLGAKQKRTIYCHSSLWNLLRVWRLCMAMCPLAGWSGHHWRKKYHSMKTESHATILAPFCRSCPEWCSCGGMEWWKKGILGGRWTLDPGGEYELRRWGFQAGTEAGAWRSSGQWCSWRRTRRYVVASQLGGRFRRWVNREWCQEIWTTWYFLAERETPSWWKVDLGVERSCTKGEDGGVPVWK